MTREDMFKNIEREDWMTPELEEELQGLARDGMVTCAQAQKFARDNNIVMKKMKMLLDATHLKVKSCQLGLF